jgi:hypothetical protein
MLNDDPTSDAPSVDKPVPFCVAISNALYTENVDPDLKYCLKLKHDPSLSVFREDTVDPTLIQLKPDREDPTFPTPRNEHVLPRLANSKVEKLGPPKLIFPLIERLEPKCTASKIDVAKLNLVVEITLTLLPDLNNVLKDNVEPNLHVSNSVKFSPILTPPLRLILEPKATQSIMLVSSPMRKFLATDTLLPNLKNERTDSPEPVFI